MDPKTIADFIARVGFPIAVSVYLLIRLDHLLREMLKALFRLNNSINSLTIRLGIPHPGPPEDLP